MGLTEASVILAKENIQPDTPESSVLSGTSVLRNTKFLVSLLFQRGVALGVRMVHGASVYGL